MGSRLHIAIHPPLYTPARPGLLGRVAQGIAHPFSMLADFLNPVRVCRRDGTHTPGQDVFAYESWDLDYRFPGHYVGHACGRCGELVTGGPRSHS